MLYSCSEKIFYWSKIVCHCAFSSQELSSVVDLTTSILGSYIPGAIRDTDFYKQQPRLNELSSSYQPAVLWSLFCENKKAVKKKNLTGFRLTAEAYTDRETEEDLAITVQSATN